MVYKVKSLSLKLTVITFILFGFLFFISAAIIHSYINREMTDLLRKRMISTSKSIANEFSGTFTDYLVQAEAGSPFLDAIRTRLHEKRVNFSLVSLEITDTLARTIVSTRPEKAFGFTNYALLSGKTAKKTLLRGEMFATPVYEAQGRPFMSVYMPLKDEKGGMAAFLIVEASADYFRIIKKIRQFFLASGGILVFFVLVFSFVVSRVVARPIRSLVATTAQIGAGRLGVQSGVASNDEIGRLSSAVNAMSLQLKKDREQLDDKIASLMILAGGIAHEIRNPLNGISLYVDLMKKRIAGSREAESCDKIKGEIRRIDAIITQLLHFTRPEELSWAPVDLKILMERVREYLVLPDLTLLGLDKPRVIEADELKIQQVLINILQNAAEAAGSAGRVLMAVQKDPGRDETIISVHNSGETIPASDRGKLFTPFFTTKPSGTGLGLALCRKIIEAHKGRIELLNSDKAGFATMAVITLNGGTHG